MYNVMHKIVKWCNCYLLVTQIDLSVSLIKKRSNTSKGPLSFSFFSKWSFKFQKSQTSPLIFKSPKQVLLVFKSFQTSPFRGWWWWFRW